MEKLLWVVPIVIVSFMPFMLLIALMHYCTKSEDQTINTDDKTQTYMHKRGHIVRDGSPIKEELLNSFGPTPKLMLAAKNLNKFIGDPELIKIADHLSELALINKIDFELNITCSEVDGLLYFDLKVVDFLYTFKREKTTKVVEFLTAGALNDDEKSFILISALINTRAEMVENYSKEQLLKTIEDEARVI